MLNLTQVRVLPQHQSANGRQACSIMHQSYVVCKYVPSPAMNLSTAGVTNAVNHSALDIETIQ